MYISPVRKLITAVSTKTLADTPPYRFQTECPVTKGGLLQYPKHVRSVLPVGFWYIARDEPWDAAHHPDTVEPFSRQRRGKAVLLPQPDPDKTRQNVFDREIEVTDRVTMFISREPDQATRGVSVPMTFQIDADRGSRLEILIYHSTERHPEHSALRGEDGELKRSFSLWPRQFADIPEPKRFGFKKQKVKNVDKPFYSVHGIVELEAREGHLGVRLRLLRPKESFKYRKSRCKYCRACRPFFFHD